MATETLTDNDGSFIEMNPEMNRLLPPELRVEVGEVEVDGEAAQANAVDSKRLMDTEAKGPGTHFGRNDVSKNVVSLFGLRKLPKKRTDKKK